MPLLRIFLPTMLFLVVLIVACGDGDSDESSGDADIKEIGQTLAVAEGEVVWTSGFLIADTGGSMRLCSLLLESFPPQCGGERIELFGFDVGTVPDTQSAQNTGEIQTLTWTNHQITVTGNRTSEGLEGVRLSGGPVNGTPPPGGKKADRDCDEFDTWQEAQAYFEAEGGPARDPHTLDDDKDGTACESLPGAP